MKRWWIGAMVVMGALVTLGILWAVINRSDRQVEQVKDLQKQLFAEASRHLSREDRRAQFSRMRTAMERLDENQRREVWSEMRRSMQQRMHEQIKQYFALPKSEQTAFLDSQINRMEGRREQSIGRGDPNRERFGRGNQRARGLDSNMSTADRAQRRDDFKRRRLDGTTPQLRAEMAAYRQALRDRREQRGLPDRWRR